MNDDTNKFLKEIKEVLEIVNSKVKMLESSQRLTSHQITFIKDQQSVMNEKLTEHTDKLDALMAETLDMHQQVGAIWDRISLESDENAKQIKEIKQHVGLPTNPNYPLD